MKHSLKKLAFILGLFLGGVTIAFGASSLQYYAGGTGGITAGYIPFGSGAYSAAATSTNLFWDNTNGRLGIGSTTPWGLFSVASSTWGNTASDYARPLFVVSTSTDSFGQLVQVFATTTEQNSIALIANDISSVLDTGVRFIIGPFIKYRGLVLDQLNVNGRINTGDWTLAECKGGTGQIGSTFISDQANACGDFGYQIDGTGSFRFLDGTTSPAIPMQLQLSANAVSNGAAIVVAGTNLWASGATSTPIMEAIVSAGKIGLSVNGLSTTTAYVGMINIDPSGTTFETAPTAGCYFTASSTEANWKAVCSASASAMTIFDTGIPSSTRQFLRFRIEMDNNEGRFYTQSTSTSLITLGKVSGANYPATVALVPTIMQARGATGSLVADFFIQDVRVWFRRTLWPN